MGRYVDAVAFHRDLALKSLQSKSVVINNQERPDEVSTWLKNGRKLHATPAIQSVEVFGTAWLKWWVHLQPQWRGKEPDLSCDVPEDGQWQGLQKGGPNGLYLVLLSYFWWGAYALTRDGEEIEPAHTKWCEQFDDIEWVLDQMIEDLEHSHKRLQEEENVDEDDAKPHSKRFAFSILSVQYNADRTPQG